MGESRIGPIGMKPGSARGLRAIAAGLALAAAALLAGAGAASAAVTLPPFVLFGWLSPPPESTTAERIGEMADLGLNLMLPCQDDTGDPARNLHRLDLAAQFRMQALVYDNRLARAWRAGFLTPTGAAVIDSVDATYPDHPGFLGWYSGDKPRPPPDT